MCCVYCDLPIVGPVKFYGSDPLHLECHEALNMELEVLYLEEEGCQQNTE